jgi:hypothetical protein
LEETVQESSSPESLFFNSLLNSFLRWLMSREVALTAVLFALAGIIGYAISHAK